MFQSDWPAAYLVGPKQNANASLSVSNDKEFQDGQSRTLKQAQAGAGPTNSYMGHPHKATVVLRPVYWNEQELVWGFCDTQPQSM